MFSPTFLQMAPGWLVAGGVFILIIVFYFIGHSIRARRIRLYPDITQADSGKMSAILIGLLSFLLAFTFGMSNSRFDKRRALAVEEANEIEKAYMRTKAYPDSFQKILTPLFNEYLEARIAFSTGEFNTKEDLETIHHHYERAHGISKKIWNVAVSYVEIDAFRANTSQLLPAINSMIEITTTRREAGESTVPDPILYFLFILSFCASFLLGYESKGKTDWFILSIYVIMISSTILAIIDLDRPRAGFIRMDLAVQKIIELRGTFK